MATREIVIGDLAESIEIRKARQHKADAADDDEAQEKVDGAEDDRTVQRVRYHEETLAYFEIRRLHGQPIRRQHGFFHIGCAGGAPQFSTWSAGIMQTDFMAARNQRYGI
jgi:hypothetical protein